MQKKTKRPFMAYGLLALLVITAILYVFQPYCNKQTVAPVVSTVPKPNIPQIPVPDFNADSAFFFVKKQVDFGPRVPNSPAHKKCAAWFVQEFKRNGLTVFGDFLRAGRLAHVLVRGRQRFRLELDRGHFRRRKSVESSALLRRAAGGKRCGDGGRHGERREGAGEAGHGHS